MNEIFDTVCKNLPKNMSLWINFECGKYWIELLETTENIPLDLPDATNKTVEEQLNDAVNTAIVFNRGYV